MSMFRVSCFTVSAIEFVILPTLGSAIAGIEGIGTEPDVKNAMIE